MPGSGNGPRRRPVTEVEGPGVHRRGLRDRRRRAADRAGRDRRGLAASARAPRCATRSCGRGTEVDPGHGADRRASPASARWPRSSSRPSRSSSPRTARGAAASRSERSSIRAEERSRTRSPARATARPSSRAPPTFRSSTATGPRCAARPRRCRRSRRREREHHARAPPSAASRRRGRRATTAPVQPVARRHRLDQEPPEREPGGEERSRARARAPRGGRAPARTSPGGARATSVPT